MMTGHRSTRILARPSVEVLDERIVPSGGPTPADQALVALRGGQALGHIYQEFVSYEGAGGQGMFHPVEAGQIFFSGPNGTSVGVDIRYSGGNFNTLVGQLRGLGMQVTATLPQREIVEGYLPISQLPVVVSNGFESSISPVYKPGLNVPRPVTPTPAPAISPQQTAVTLKGGPALGSIYGEFVAYQQAGSQGPFNPLEAGRIFFSGTSVGVDIRFGSGDFNTLVAQLQGRGFQLTAVNVQNRIVEGYLPIAQLPVVATNGFVSQLSPVYKPVFSGPAPAPATSPQQTAVTLKGGPALGSIYGEFVAYQQAGSQGPFNPPEAGRIFFSGTSVGVDIRFGGGDFNTLIGQLQGLGFQLTAVNVQNRIVEGYLPIAQLPVVATNGFVSQLSPVYKPVFS